VVVVVVVAEVDLEEEEVDAVASEEVEVEVSVAEEDSVVEEVHLVGATEEVTKDNNKYHNSNNNRV
jgi:hypothetical protein